MNVIVYDLELMKRFKKGQLSQIVEIGACKVDLDSSTIVDQFQIYVAPKSGYIAKSTRKFINMKKEDMKNAVSFAQAIDAFKNWIGDDYYLCSWGKDDRLHIIDQCARYKINLDWFQNYNDIQNQIGALLRKENKNQLGLMNALELAGIKAVGDAHSGIDDAINTAKLFVLFADQITLQHNQVSPEEILRHRRDNKSVKYKRKTPLKTSN